MVKELAGMSDKLQTTGSSMNDQSPLVTIITVTRNRSSLISRAIESILSQTYRNIEYIIVDGASTDNTREVVGRYRDPRLQYIYLDKYGRIPQTRAGFEASTGKYITFLDDDDEYLPTKVDKQVALIESLPSEYGFVYCWMTYFDNTSHRLLRRHKPELRGNVAHLVAEKPVVSGTPTFLFRRKVFEEFGGTFKEVGLDSDWELATRVCQKYLVDFVPEFLINVYINHGMTRMSDPGFFRDSLQRQIIFHEYFLTEFRDTFDECPRKKAWHLGELARCCFMLGDWKRGWRYHRDLLLIAPTLRALMLPAYGVIKRKR